MAGGGEEGEREGRLPQPDSFSLGCASAYLKIPRINVNNSGPHGAVSTLL